MGQRPRRAPPEQGAASGYRIQTVARRTGVATAVLRAWERRYGIPSPARTGTAYRLYSEADIAIVERMRDLRASGLSASEAASLVLQDPPSATESRPATEAAGMAAQVPGSGSAVERLLDATARLDAREIDRILALLSTTGDPLLAFEEVIRPVLARVGEAWHEGTLTEAHEHLLSEQVSGALRAWITLLRPREPTARVLVACLAEELHALPAQGFALRLAAWGYDPIVLGARTPPAALRAAVAKLDPTLVALSTTTSNGDVRALVPEYAVACGRVPWLVGGAGSTQIATTVLEHGGTVAPAEPERQRALIAALAGRSSSAPRPVTPLGRRPAT